jgi:hypothetical protein
VEATDVVRVHQFTLARRRGDWEVIETPELRLARQQILHLTNEMEQRVLDRTREFVEVNQRLRGENTGPPTVVWSGVADVG